MDFWFWHAMCIAIGRTETPQLERATMTKHTTDTKKHETETKVYLRDLETRSDPKGGAASLRQADQTRQAGHNYTTGGIFTITVTVSDGVG